MWQNRHMVVARILRVLPHIVCRAWVAFILRRLRNYEQRGIPVAKQRHVAGLSILSLLGFLAVVLTPVSSRADPSYQIFVSNEKSENVTVINGSDFSVAATIPVGKRPRGIHSSPDGRTVYVALSGTPVKAPPQIVSSRRARARTMMTTTGIPPTRRRTELALSTLPAGS